MISSRLPSNYIVSQIASDIVSKQYELAQVQEQISSGKKVNRPSDEPAYSARILSMREATSKLEQYDRNSSAAESQLSLEEGALDGVVNNINRIRELALTANNGIVNETTRQAIHAEVKLQLDELYTLANSRDSFNNFIFGGNNNQSTPFSKGEPVVYSGSDDASEMPIGLGRKVKTGDSGLDVFMRIRNGNGTFVTSLNPANTGSGTISQGSVTDTTAYDRDTYRVQFTSSTTYDVINDTTGATVSTSNTHTDTGPIEFNGIRTVISGVPEPGDSFTIEPSKNQDLFSTVSKFISALDQTPTTSSDTAKYTQAVNDAILNLDTGLDHINNIRSGVGARLNSIDSSREQNSNVQLQIERVLTDVEDIDIAEAVTNLQTQANSLEILQKSFSRIEGLSLFNYM
ncbi:MAG: flagellar hook-associated protein FlgL [Granulosicoccus sp.]